MIDGESICYSCAPSVAWVKDSGQTILIKKETGESWTLSGVETAIWDLVTLGYPAERLARLLSVLLAQSPQEAQALLARVLGTWAQAGIVCAEEGGGHGQPGD